MHGARDYNYCNWPRGADYDVGGHGTQTEADQREYLARKAARLAAERGEVPSPQSSGTLIIHARPFVWRDPQTIPPRHWLYGRHYIRRYPTATIAREGVGKTGLAINDSIAMASGRDLLGLGIRAPLTVWYVNLEDPLEEIERRVAAVCRHYDINTDDIAGRLFINSGRETPIVLAEKVGERVVVHAPLVKAILEEIRENKIDVVIIDPFVSSHGVPENDNGAVDRVVKTWASIADEGNCAVELIHHARKSAPGVQAEYTVDDARGAVAMVGAVRSARVINVMSSSEAERAGVSPQDRRLYFRVDNGKSNMHPPSNIAVWRKLVSVGLGNPTPEDPEDWVGVVTPWTMPGAFDGLHASDLRKVQDKIAAGQWAENVQATNWAGYAIAEALELPSETPAEKQRLKTLLRTWRENGALKVERQHDARAGRDKPFIVVGERAV